MINGNGGKDIISKVIQLGALAVVSLALIYIVFVVIEGQIETIKEYQTRQTDALISVKDALVQVANNLGAVEREQIKIKETVEDTNLRLRLEGIKKSEAKQ